MEGSLIITGEVRAGRFVVTFGNGDGAEGREALLTPAIFKVLLRLVWALRVQNVEAKEIRDGWIPREKVVGADLATRYLHRLKREIGGTDKVFESDVYGRVRLLIDRAKVVVDVPELSALPDFEIRQMAGDIDRVAPTGAKGEA